MGKMNVTDNSFLRQFETEVEGEIAKIEYAQQERKIFLTKLVVPKDNCPTDFSDAFIKEVLAIIAERNVSMMPTSPEIVRFIRKNKRYRSMLPIGVRI
ncbi:MAG: N-acetyltransferase [Bacteroidetes bacterium]|nr:N-acetyltransferase [Bacteroidota bacterium]MDA0888216.1 N-acetyltransferase [Bacteroidota bacterium]MDA1084338.1 N-acetyltransferase [Bacteroidota bacterium]